MLPPVRLGSSVASLAAGLLAVLALPTSTRAQRGEAPTRGIDLPASAVAGDFDAFALEDNPAGLGMLQDYSFTAAHVALDRDGRRPGGGTGGFFAKPVTLPFLTSLSYGLAAQYLRAPEGFRPTNEEAVKLSFGGAYKLSPTLALGLAWHRFLADEVTDLDTADTVDLGLAARAESSIGLGFVVHDLNTPLVGGIPTQRRYDAEVLVRPTGTSRLEIAAGIEIGERRGTASPRARVAFSPYPGINVRAEAQYSSFADFDGAGVLEERHELRATAGLELSVGRAAAGGAALFGDGRDGAGYHGTSFWMRLSGEKSPSLLPTPKHMERLILEGGLGGGRRFTRLIAWMRRLERDDAVNALVVRIDGLALGWGQVQELRRSFQRLRAAGKQVFAYILAGTSRDYYLGAAASKLYLDPGGGLRLVGLSATVLYFKGLFDKLAVQADFIKIAEYKSAPEQFTRDAPSKPAQEMRDAIFDGIYGELTTDLAKDRGLTPAAVQKAFDDGPYTPPEALKAKLVDEVATDDQLDRLIARELGGYYPVIDADPVNPLRKQWTYPAIAVIHLDGDIVDGKSMTIPLLGRTLVGGDTIAASLIAARMSPRVKAIVLRIDSPGGSALASEIIAREVERTRRVKPVICSLGDTAASGGYFAAAPCHRIFAMPATITGSIGIFTGKFDVSGLAAKLGVSYASTKRGAHADMESIFRLYSEDERKLLLDKLGYYYRRFTGTVARGRGMTMQKVHEHARGRVWTGRQALERNLIDEYGNIGDALAYAKAKGGIGEDTPTEMIMLPAQGKDLISQLLGLLGGGSQSDEQAAQGALAFFPELERLLRVMPAALAKAPNTPQARLEFDLDLR